MTATEVPVHGTPCPHCTVVLEDPPEQVAMSDPAEVTDAPEQVICWLLPGPLATAGKAENKQPAGPCHPRPNPGGLLYLAKQVLKQCPGETGTLTHGWWGCEMVQPLV